MDFAPKKDEPDFGTRQPVAFLIAKNQNAICQPSLSPHAGGILPDSVRFPGERATNGMDVPDFLLPKGRTVAIHGDAVRTLRIHNGLSVAQLAANADMSIDRIMEIEKGGQKVYAASLLNIAHALGLGNDWRPLLDGADKNGAVAAPSAKRTTRAITISEDFEKFMSENQKDSLIQKLSQAIDALNEIIVHVVRKGSVILEIEMSEEDWRKV